MNSFSNEIRNAMIWTVLAAGMLCGQLAFSVKASPETVKRTINIKERVESDRNAVKLKDFVINKGMLSDEELEFDIVEVSEKREKTLSLVDLACVLQNYNSLMNVQLRGPSYITVRRLKSSEHLDRARREIADYIKGNPPWNDWEVDVLLNSNDELLLSKAGEFSKLEVKSYSSSKMLGTVAFRIILYDMDGRQKDILAINPVIQRKVDVIVAADSLQKGQIIRKGDLKTAPMWIDGSSRDMILDEADCIGKEVAKKVNSGEFIRTSDVLMPVCAKKGDIIWVECISGALSVRVAATVLENGRLGDFIKVRNNSSQKVIDVELTEEKTARKRI
ncbi:MAG: flagella basal body P-ring formation protein FlgA [Lentisphaerae bacterium GWF2_45_14]|nr:MAG: flagella basal body P-ring formation protein FlgA [Lentisphaerae bacterium GWF2_45_14]